MQTIGFIGGGNMAEALIKGMRDAGMRDVIVSEPRAERRQELARVYGVGVTDSNKDVMSASKIVILAVKPQQMEQVLTEIAPLTDSTKTIVTIAAGITLAFYRERLRTDRIIRIMPNLGALKQESMSVMSICECFTGPEIDRVKEIFMAAGRVIALPERMMDAVTALSGSGPAFIALFMDAMREAGIKLGLPEDAARELAIQTLRGTAALLDGDLEATRLIEMVRSPGGTTAEGLKVFEARELRQVVDEALSAAARRSRELAR